MITDKFKLKHFFWELCQIGVNDHAKHPTFGFATSKLMEDMFTRQEQLLDRMLNDYTGEGHEYRLNGAGLKMYWRMRKDGDKRHWVCSISGDQAKDYPFFMMGARQMIKNYGCSKITWREVR